MAKIIKKRGRALLHVPLAFVLFVVMVFLLLLTPPVQSFIASKATVWLRDSYGLDISIGYVAIKPMQRVELKEVRWNDYTGDTLAYLKRVEIDMFYMEQDSLKLSLQADQIVLDSPVFKLRKYPGDTISNLLMALAPFSSSEVDTTPGKDFELLCNNVLLHNGRFLWNDSHSVVLPFGVDWNHILVSDLQGDFSAVKILNDSVNAYLNHFSLKEQSGFTLDTLSGQAIYSNTVTQVEGMTIVTTVSRLAGRLRFSYADVTDYADFNHAVSMKGVLDSSFLNMQDITYFAPELKGLDYTLSLDAKVRGTVDNLKLRKATIGFGKSSYLSGDFDLDGLPEVNDMFINARFKKLHTHYSDIAAIPSYPFEAKGRLPVPELFATAGDIQFSGDFTGFVNDFVAYGVLESAYGKLTTDIKLKNEKNRLAYRGRVEASRFDLGKLTGSDLLGELNAELKVDGFGLTPEELVADFVTHINALDIAGYNYTDIDIEGSMVKGNFHGNFEIDDPNIALRFDGGLALLEEKPEYKFTADIEHFNPVRLKLVPNDTDLIVSGLVDFNFQGNSLNDIVGRIDVDSLSLAEGELVGVWEYVNFLAITAGNEKTFSLKSPDLDVTLAGSFKTESIPTGISKVLYGLAPSIFQEQPQLSDEGHYRLSVDWKRTGNIARILIPGFSKAIAMKVELEYASLHDSLNLLATGRELDYAGLALDTYRLTLKSLQRMGELAFRTEELHLTDSAKIIDFTLDTRMQSDSANTHIKWNNASSPRYSGDLSLDWLLSGALDHDFVFKPSNIVFADTSWNVAEGSMVRLDSGNVSFKNFELSTGTQSLYVSGNLGAMEEEKLELRANRFLLENLNPFLAKADVELHGELNGSGFVQRPDSQLFFGSDIHATKLAINDYKIGRADFTTNWNPVNRRLELNAGINREGFQTLSVNGNYYPDRADSSLMLGVHFNSFDLRVLNEFLADYVNFVKGKLNGTVSLSGTPNEPVFDGRVVLDTLIAGVNYLNTYYAIHHGEVFIEKDLIGADYLLIEDQQQRKSYANLSIFHDNFSDFTYDIWVYADEGIKGLNTKKGTNEYFYGSAVLQKGSSITLETGENGLMHLLVDAKSEPGTQLFIPLSEGSTVASSEFVHFVNYSALTDSTEFSERRIKEKGSLSMDFEFGITDETNVQLILDPVMGDAIDARGNGDVSLEIDENDNFFIYGTYELTGGEYTFTLENIINKKFSIQQGGTISWDGDPYEGLADITTKYKVRTALYTLNLPTLTTDSSELMRKINVELNLHLSGNYMNPEIRFSFSLPTQYADVETLLNMLEDGEKNKQVFGLLLLGRFLPVSAGGESSAGINNALGNSTSEMLSNQLSGWLSQISDDFDLGVNYRPGDALTSDEVEVMMSTQLWDNRLTLETQVGVQGDNPNTQETTNQIVGDFLLEYKISEDGRVRAKAFNRSNTYNPIYDNQAPYTQGGGISYQENFSSFSHLTCKIRSRLMSPEKRKELDCDARERARLQAKHRKYAKKKGVILKD